MAGYITVNRLSLIQLETEERKYRAHLKKVAEMKRHSSIDNKTPVKCPHLKISRDFNIAQRRHEIEQQNKTKSQKLVEIMKKKSKTLNSQQSTILPQLNRKLSISTNSPFNGVDTNAKIVERLVKTKGIYNVKKWNDEYELHKSYLEISKNNKLFTPIGIGVNNRIAKTATPKTSTPQSRRTGLTSSSNQILDKLVLKAS
ncbi:unnamed protein product [Didymodactylos carnosus]|uniref:Uncharacterized protein n=1 Tax=Didymodactylos carnosus TaxID=1234261 RepID=A0A813TUK1_9BILA|nr:unnamed protein product [Didymodactylos carnosus]CAF0818655.1 unnamed protein product [Didymodactylos carnosus]CAF3581835.1 unnamed protein product [Didymodactylos carnosus]CAF3604849.1 unnamed protein product [Didymodactylos carnosus]